MAAAPTRGPAAHHDGPAGPGLGPVGRGRVARAAPDVGHRRSAQPDGGTRTSTPPGRARAPGPPATAMHQIDQVGRSARSASTVDRASLPSAVAASPANSEGTAATAPRTSGAGAGPAADAPDRAARRPPEEGDRAGPAPGRPIGQVDHGRAAGPNQTRSSAAARAHAPGGVDVDPRRPSPRRGGRAARRAPGCRRDCRRSSLRERRSRRLGHGGHIGAHAHHVATGVGTRSAVLDDSEAESRPQVVDPRRRFPGEFLLRAPEVAVGRRLLVDRAAQVEVAR